ncbi:MAG: phosphoenolpyruvate--protein phosphotransferase [candidate division WOR-3 bacterium]|nr:phosphoenolpyruvate--protein phosphotransferase [candidate division WOR-3 bacterium]
MARKEKTEWEARRQAELKEAELPAITRDGAFRAEVVANIGGVEDAEQVLQFGGEGVGLFRTEFLYLERSTMPSIVEQVRAYRRVFEILDGRPLVVRTLDIGGDKDVPYLGMEKEPNPFLGWRAIRLCLDDPVLFKGQLRAILRASLHGNVKVMFPMIATIEELRRAKLLLEEAKKELRKEGKGFNEQMEVGVMIETPSAALLAQQLARECNFLSIGSNDLTQYTLAVDRGNKLVAKLFDHLHPAVLQLIKKTIDAAHQQGVWVGMCGEFGADPLGIILLLGMGIDEISVVPGMIPEAKSIIRSVDTTVARDVASQAVELSTALEVERLLYRELHRRFSKLAQSLFAVEARKR